MLATIERARASIPVSDGTAGIAARGQIACGVWHDASSKAARHEASLDRCFRTGGKVGMERT
jgi:hypothetical protein